jgi:hypothetical protein
MTPEGPDRCRSSGASSLRATLLVGEAEDRGRGLSPLTSRRARLGRWRDPGEDKEGLMRTIFGACLLALYTVTTEIPGEPTETRSGTWASSSDVLTLRQTGIAGDLQFDYALSGNTLTASGANGEFDFDGDGAMEPAKLSIVATRSP